MSDIFDSVVIELPRDAVLLERFYTELMQTNFPIAEELEPLQAWIDQLEGFQRSRHPPTSPSFSHPPHPASPSSPPPRIPRSDGVGPNRRRCTLHILVAFDARDSQRRTLLGGIVFEYYFPSNCALITYLVINPSQRGQGLAVYLTIQAYALMRRTSRSHGFPTPFVIFCEVNDPLLIDDSTDAFSPLTRLRAFQNAGVRALSSFPYIQPSLEHGKEKARDMLLAAVVGPMTDRDDDGRPYVRSQHLTAFLHDFYAELQVPDYSNDADFRTMMAALEGRERVPLVDFDLSRFKPRTKKVSLAAGSPSARVHSIPKKIIVVGAGLSGLACAHALHRVGFHVTVVEARHRIGGRVHTGRTFETRVDLGAAWLHGLDGNALHEYAVGEMKGLKLYKSDEQSVQLYGLDGAVIPDDDVMDAYLRFVTLTNEVDAAYSSEDGHRTPSLQTAIEQLMQQRAEYAYKGQRDRLTMNCLFSQLESLQNASMIDLNAKDYGYGTQYEGGDNIVVNGYHNIVLALSQSLDIRLSSPVTRIDYSSPTVRVTTASKEEMECDAVVVSLPIGVLKAGTVVYQPPLPEWKVRAWEGIGMGLYDKVILRFPSVFWPKHVDYFACIFDPAEPPAPSDSAHVPRLNCWFVNYFPVAAQPVLIAMVSAQYAAQLEAMSDAEVRESVMRRVRFMFRDGAQEPLDVQVTRWGRDEWSRGSYSFLQTGGVLGCMEEAGKQVGGGDGAGRLFWCGEHTSVERFGYADGAYVSGLREADKIVKQYEQLVCTATEHGKQPQPQQQRLPSKL